MDSLLGKRKASSDGAADSPSSQFATVPEACWTIVASFAAPPDVYNLALSSKHFFCSSCDASAASDAPAGRRSNRIKAAAAAKSAGDGIDFDRPLLATKLLRASLLSSLGRVLENSRSGITLESVLEMPAGALVAGSTIAQACLGVLWTSDVDVFCSAKAAPLVRSWLVESANCMFGGFHDTYMDVADSRLLYTLDTKIHHVEKWGHISRNMNEELEGLGAYSYGDKTVADANAEGAGIGVESLKDTEYYRDSIEYGRNCQARYVDWKWKMGMYFDELGVDQNKAYSIKPRPGGNLPFDFHGDGSIDLIVARMKFRGSKEKVTPFDLLEDFDLTICKASFDGKAFRVPDPHRTFSAQSTTEPNRRAVVESYMKHFKLPESRYIDVDAQSALALATIKKVRKDVPNVPFYRQVDLAAKLPEPQVDELFGFINPFDRFVQLKRGGSIQFHNWVRKLILRLRKYQQRGITVIDAPTISDDFQIHEFNVCSHGG